MNGSLPTPRCRLGPDLHGRLARARVVEGGGASVVIHEVADALACVANLPALGQRVLILKPAVGGRAASEWAWPLTARGGVAVMSHSPLRPRVLPLRRLSVVVHKVHSVVGVHAPLWVGGGIDNVCMWGVGSQKNKNNKIMKPLQGGDENSPQPGGSGPRGSFSADIMEACPGTQRHH